MSEDDAKLASRCGFRDRPFPSLAGVAREGATRRQREGGSHRPRTLLLKRPRRVLETPRGRSPFMVTLRLPCPRVRCLSCALFASMPHCLTRYAHCGRRTICYAPRRHKSDFGMRTVAMFSVLSLWIFLTEKLCGCLVSFSQYQSPS